MTVTEPEALQAMLAHHRVLEEGVRARVDAFVDAAAGGEQSARAGAELVAYLASEVLPHARAEERTVYRSARTLDDLGDTLEQMIGEHETLAAAAGRLAASPGSAEAPAEAERLAALFSSHVAKENEIVLPVLVADGAVDLAAVLAEMHALVEAARHTPEERDQPGAEPVSATLGNRPADGAGADIELDVRSFAPAQRHQLIFSTYEELVPGTWFVLVNDHDPKPLGYQFEAEHPGQYSWEYLEDGPVMWRVRIGRPAA